MDFSLDGAFKKCLRLELRRISVDQYAAQTKCKCAKPITNRRKLSYCVKKMGRDHLSV